MYLQHENLLVRNATGKDAGLLCAWWNDGAVMAHAGFPNGLGTTPDNIRESLLGDADDTGRRHIIELDGIPIGEMNYRNKGEGVAEIGIKICNRSMQEKGYGRIILSMMIQALFHDLGYRKIILGVNVNNKRAQHVYELLGFLKGKVEKDAFQDQLGNWQSVQDY